MANFLVEKLFELLDHKMFVEKKVNLFYEAAFQELIESGEDIFAVDVTENNCMEIDTAHDLEVANTLIQQSF